MKILTKLLIFICLLYTPCVFGQNTYYIKQNGGTGDGLSDATAWSFDKLNGTIIPKGSTILFKRGDTFSFMLNNRQSNVIYGAYGSGSDPVISGLSSLKNWLLLKGNIYYATLDVSSLNMVMVDGIIKPMGRYPKKGYLAYTAHDKNLSLSGPSVTDIPFDPSGGEIVIRKDRWILDRHPISSRSGDKITYTTNNKYGNNNAYTPKDKNGYFIQNHLGTLTADGDWYYDLNAKRLYMYFKSKPDGKVINVSALDKNVEISTKEDVVFNNITFEGANVCGARIVGSSNISFNNCHWRNEGGDAIWGGHLTGLLVNGGSITNSLNNGIIIEYEGNNVVIDKVKISNSGTIAGAGRSGDGAQIGVFVVGQNTKITNCTVTNSGYSAIDFSGGDNAYIEHNLVDTFCTIKDDGGGIYTHSGINATINQNIVLNAIGAYEGAGWGYWEPFGKAAGIYLDNGTTNHYDKVTNNTIAHGQWAGIFVNDNGNNTLTGNLVYDQLYPLFLMDFTGPINNAINDNQFIAKKKTQYAVRIELGKNNNDIHTIGLINKNIYARPINDTNTLSIYKNFAGGGLKYMSIGDWKKITNLDVNSTGSSKSITNENQLLFEYNSTNADKTVSISGTYIDFYKKTYTGHLVLKPFTSIVLIRI